MIKINNVSKTFETAGGKVYALKNVSLDIKKGDIFGIIGMSGAGKSTLVRCINMLEKPTEGSITINGEDMGGLKGAKLRKRRRKISMIFQSFNLLAQRNCIDNICFPLELAGVKKSEAKKRAAELLKTVGLPDKGAAYPAQLSGGQQQRIAIARALATDPEILLCDEATSALDPKTTESVLELIKEINQKLGITVVVITHQMSVVEKICNRVAILDGGELCETGAVSEIFTNPKSNAAKHLVYPDGAENSVPHFASPNVIRLVYNGGLVADKPLIAKMAAEKGIVANILAAQTKCIGDKVFGNMLLDIEGGNEELKKAMEYLNSIPDLSAKKVKDKKETEDKQNV